MGGRSPFSFPSLPSRFRFPRFPFRLLLPRRSRLLKSINPFRPRRTTWSAWVGDLPEWVGFRPPSFHVKSCSGSSDCHCQLQFQGRARQQFGLSLCLERARDHRKNIRRIETVPGRCERRAVAGSFIFITAAHPSCLYRWHAILFAIAGFRLLWFLAVDYKWLTVNFLAYMRSHRQFSRGQSNFLHVN